MLELLGHGNQLKRTARTGWVQRGVVNPEDVAAHSFGVVYIVLMLSSEIEEPVALEKALIMAVLHDLPEGLTTDIPAPAWQFLPPGIKTAVEHKAMVQILGDAPQADALLSCWEELHADETAEAHLVHDADKLDMYLQAAVYEQQTGNRRLEEFWDNPRVFHYPQAQALYDELRTLRKRE
jgi:putative hydrolase of HD superfamily